MPNKLTYLEIEIIGMIAEEAGEVIQACGKILRRGFNNKNPEDLDSLTNREDLVSELDDLSAVTSIALFNGIFGEHRKREDQLKSVSDKIIKKQKWMNGNEK